MIKSTQNHFQSIQKLRIVVAELCSIQDQAVLNSKYNELIELMGNQLKNMEDYSWHQLMKLVEVKIRVPDFLFFMRFNEILKILYAANSPLVYALYEILPQLVVKFQLHLQQTSQEKQIPNQLKGEYQSDLGIDAVVLTVYNNQLPSYLHYQQTLQIHEVSSVTALFPNLKTGRSHFPPQNQVKFSNKFRIKSFLLFLYYYHIRNINDRSIVSFFKLIYIFCGGMIPPDSFSLHLLNSLDEFSIFLYRISQEQFQWILMSLYYIYIHKKQLKFQVVSALTLIRKKCGNECKFRLTDIAQSLLHLLENQYEDIF